MYPGRCVYIYFLSILALLQFCGHSITQSEFWKLSLFIDFLMLQCQLPIYLKIVHIIGDSQVYPSIDPDASGWYLDYGDFTGYISYHISHPLYTAPCCSQVYISAAAFMVISLHQISTCKSQSWGLIQDDLILAI